MPRRGLDGRPRCVRRCCQVHGLHDASSLSYSEYKQLLANLYKASRRLRHDIKSFLRGHCSLLSCRVQPENYATPVHNLLRICVHRHHFANYMSVQQKNEEMFSLICLNSCMLLYVLATPYPRNSHKTLHSGTILWYIPPHPHLLFLGFGFLDGWRRRRKNHKSFCLHSLEIFVAFWSCAV